MKIEQRRLQRAHKRSMCRFLTKINTVQLILPDLTEPPPGYQFVLPDFTQAPPGYQFVLPDLSQPPPGYQPVTLPSQKENLDSLQELASMASLHLQHVETEAELRRLQQEHQMTLIRNQELEHAIQTTETVVEQADERLEDQADEDAILTADIIDDTPLIDFTEPPKTEEYSNDNLEDKPTNEELIHDQCIDVSDLIDFHAPDQPDDVVPEDAEALTEEPPAAIQVNQVSFHSIRLAQAEVGNAENLDDFCEADTPTVKDLENLGFGTRASELRRLLSVKITRQAEEAELEDIAATDTPPVLPLRVGRVQMSRLPHPPPFMDPENPLVISIKPRKIQTAHLDSALFHPLDETPTLSGETLPFISITSGSEPYSGVPLLSLKDSGCTHTLISKPIFLSHPTYRHCQVLPCNTLMQTADNNEKLTCSEYAEMYLTFKDITGKMLTFPHPVFIVEGLAEQFFLGQDILGTSRKIYETPDRIVLARDLSIPSSFVHTTDPNAYIIPIHNRELTTAPNIVMQRQVTLKSFCARVVTQAMIPGMDYAHETYSTKDGTVNATVSLNMTDRLIEISLENKQGAHQTLEIGDRLIPICEAKRVCATALLREKIWKDKYYTNEEKMNQMRHYDMHGDCSITASQYVDNHPRLQTFEPPSHAKDHTPEALIAGLPLSHLSKDLQAKVRAVFKRRIKSLAVNDFDVPETTLMEMDIELKDNVKIMCPKFIPVANHVVKQADELVAFYLENKVIRRASDHTDASPFISNMFFIPKKDKNKIRAILDSRVINFNTKKIACSVASHAEIIDLLTNKKFISTVDLSNAYFAIPIKKSAQKFTSFYTHTRERMVFCRAPQGFINSAQALDVLLSKCFAGLKGVTWFADDVCLASDGTVEEHLELLDEVLRRLIAANLKCAHTKVNILQEEVEFLGIIYNKNTMSIPKAKLAGYRSIEPPDTPRKMKTFLCSLNFYRKWIKNYAEITLPLHKLSLQPTNTRLTWLPEHHAAFAQLMKSLEEVVALNMPLPDRQFVCYSDASSYALSFVVEQVDKMNNRFPISFISKMLSRTEQNYSTVKKEALALLFGLVSMDFWFAGLPLIILYTDAHCLIWLGACRGRNPFLTRIAIQLSTYNLELRHIEGRNNLVADILSRATRGAHDEPPGLDAKTILSEKDSEAIIRRLTIREGRVFTTSEVHQLLTGACLPAPPTSLKPKAKKVRDVPISNEIRRMPPIKYERKIRMPHTRPYHEFYRNQIPSLRRAQMLDEDYRIRTKISAIGLSEIEKYADTVCERLEQQRQVAQPPLPSDLPEPTALLSETTQPPSLADAAAALPSINAPALTETLAEKRLKDVHNCINEWQRRSRPILPRSAKKKLALINERSRPQRSTPAATSSTSAPSATGVTTTTPPLLSINLNPDATDFIPSMIVERSQTLHTTDLENQADVAAVSNKRKAEIHSPAVNIPPYKRDRRPKLPEQLPPLPASPPPLSPSPPPPVSILSLSRTSHSALPNLAEENENENENATSEFEI